MARSFSNAKLISTFVVDRIFVSVSRWGYTAATPSQGGVSVSMGGGVEAARGGMLGKKGGKESAKTSEWISDSVTGYYSPENRAVEIDMVELCEMLLKNNIRRHR
ncbi:hypothetical protein U1Q18_014832 [Sarracenia purpurea var. burkii]